MLLGKRVTLSDMEAVDSEFYSSIKYILENDPEPLCLTFTASREFLGQVSYSHIYLSVYLSIHSPHLSIHSPHLSIHSSHLSIYPFISSISHQVEEVNLKPNGGDIDITEDNKEEYVKFVY